MNEKTIRALISAGAIKKVKIIADGSLIYVELVSPNETFTANTIKGKLKTWSSIDSASKWVKSLGVGYAMLELAKWQPKQKGLQV